MLVYVRFTSEYVSKTGTVTQHVYYAETIPSDDVNVLATHPWKAKGRPVATFPSEVDGVVLPHSSVAEGAMIVSLNNISETVKVLDEKTRTLLLAPKDLQKQGNSPVRKSAPKPKAKSKTATKGKTHAKA